MKKEPSSNTSWVTAKYESYSNVLKKAVPCVRFVFYNTLTFSMAAGEYSEINEFDTTRIWLAFT